MNRTIAFLVLAIGMVSCASQPPDDVLLIDQPPVGTELGEKLDHYLIRIAPFGFGGGVLVAQGGQILLHKGYGLANRQTDQPNTVDTVFSIGSITKQFTAAAIMKLEMMGKLETEDEITKYLDDVPDDKTSITLHHLLTHTSGIINYTGPETPLADFERAPRDETIRKALEAPLEFQPGERFSYSNAGYSILALLVEELSGQSYEEFLRDQLFHPAGMMTTGYRLPDWDANRFPHNYSGEQDNGTFLHFYRIDEPYWHLWGNGGIQSTTGDMYRWHLALKSDRILSTSAKAKLFKPFLNEYAYGWDVIERPDVGTLIQHDGGGYLGNNAEMRRYIDRDVVTIILCNQRIGREPLFDLVRDKIETLVFGGNVNVPPEVLTDEGALDTYAGVYQFSDGSRLEISVKMQSLNVKPVGQSVINLLGFPEQTDTTALGVRNQRSAELFEAILEGDYEPFFESLAEPGRKDRYKKLIADRLNEVEGDLKVEAVSTLPWSDGTPVTVVHIQGKEKSATFNLRWQDGRIASMQRTTPSLEVRFKKGKQGGFVGYDIGQARTLALQFEHGSSGDVVGLTLSSMKAQRMPGPGAGRQNQANDKS